MIFGRATTPRARAGLLAGAALAASLAASAGEFPYRVLQAVHLSGAGAVQALAFGPSGKHVYAAVGMQLRSYDTASGKPGAAVKLPGTGVGLAVAARDGGLLYVATRSPARLLVLALPSMRVVSTAVLRGGAPAALLYDGEQNDLYAESRAGSWIARLDPASGKTLAVAHLHGGLRQMAVNGRGMLYVANASAEELEAIDTNGMHRAGAIPLSGCTGPSGLAMDVVGRRLFVACGNGQALVIDEDMGFTFVRLSIGRAASLRAVFASHPLGPQGWKGGAFVAGDGPELAAIQMKAFISYASGGSLPLAGRCTALAISPLAHRLVLALAPRAAGQAAAAGSGAAGSAAEGTGVELLLLGGKGQGVSQ